MTDRLETHVLVVNNVTTVRLEALTVVLTGLQLIQENLLQVVRLVPVVTLLVHLVLLVVMTEPLEMIVLQDVNGLQSVQLAMTVHLVESGLLRDLHAMTVHLVESGLLRDLHVMTELLVVNGLQSVQHVMTVHLEESGLLRDLHVMTELLVVNGLQSVQPVKKEHLVESGQMTVVQEILVDQIALLEMTTVREVSMTQETSHLTRRLSLKMSF
jgi:hypothetical protein